MTNAGLAGGGTFTADQTDLTFLGLSQISLANTVYPFVVGLNASGYVSAGAWNPVAGGNIGNTKVFYNQTADSSVEIKGLVLANINGANTATRPGSGIAAGFLATVSLLFN
jgi:hypothetical protein